MIIDNIFYVMFVYISVIIIHEIGHIITAVYYKCFKKIKIELFDISVIINNDKLTVKQYRNILMNGIMTGFIILLIASFSLNDYNFVVLTLIYLYNSSYDINNLLNVSKEKSKNKLIMDMRLDKFIINQAKDIIKHKGLYHE